MLKAEAFADVRAFSLAPRRHPVWRLASSCRIWSASDWTRGEGRPAARVEDDPGGARAAPSLALKLWSIECKRRVMALVTGEDLTLSAGLNVTPKKSYLSEYSLRVDPRKTTQIREQPRTTHRRD